MKEYTPDEFAKRTDIKAGEQFSFVYEIPQNVRENTDKLRDDLAYYIRRVVDNPNMKYVGSMLSSDRATFTLTIEMRPQAQAYTVDGLGVLPVVAWAAITAGITLIGLLAKLGFAVFVLKKVVEVTKSPVTTFNLGLILLIAGGIYFLPQILSFLEGRRKA